MANKKATKKIQPEQPAGKHLSESSPNPHGESKILHMPINTDQRNATGGRNVPQVPNTIGGKLNPSVVHEFKNRVLTDAEKMDESQQAPATKTHPTSRGTKNEDGYGRKKDA